MWKQWLAGSIASILPVFAQNLTKNLKIKKPLNATRLRDDNVGLGEKNEEQSDDYEESTK